MQSYERMRDESHLRRCTLSLDKVLCIDCSQKSKTLPPLPSLEISNTGGWGGEEVIHSPFFPSLKKGEKKGIYSFGVASKYFHGWCWELYLGVHNPRATALHKFTCIFPLAIHLLHEANSRFGLQRARITHILRSSMFENKVTQTHGGQRVRRSASKNRGDFTMGALLYIETGLFGNKKCQRFQIEDKEAVLLFCFTCSHTGKKVAQPETGKLQHTQDILH